MKKIILGLLLACTLVAQGATLTPIQLLNPAGCSSGQVITSTGTSTPFSCVTPTPAPVTSVATRTGAIVLSNTDISGLGTASTQNTGTSGATVPLLSTANTWTLAQIFSVRPTFNGNTPYDTGNLTIANYLTTASAASTYAPLASPSFSGTVASSTPIPVAAGGTGVATLTGLVLGNGTSAMSAYSGTICTNKFSRGISAGGVATCASVANTDLSNSSVTIGSTSVSLGGTASSISGLSLIAPALGTPASGVATNLTGTASGLTAGNVTTNANLTGGVTSVGNAATVVTNANLTGPITSSGNATVIAAQTGTGSTIVTQTSPGLLGTPTAPTPAQFDNSTTIPSTAFVQQAIGNHSGALVRSSNTTLTNANFGYVVTVTSSGTTQSLPNPGTTYTGASILIESAFATGSTTVNISNATQIYGPTAVGATTFVINAGESARFTIDFSGVYVVDSYTSVVGAYTTILRHSAQEVDKSYTYNQPTTGGTVTLATGTQTAIIDPSGTLATLTITLPGCTSGYDGSIARFSSSQIVTSLTVNATSGSVADAPGSLAVGGGNSYICRGSNTTWYRLS